MTSATMREQDSGGLLGLSEGRKPLVGQVMVPGHGVMMILCGMDELHEELWRDPYMVAVCRADGPCWSKDYACPKIAETVARVLEELNDISVGELEKIGLVEQRLGRNEGAD